MHYAEFRYRLEDALQEAGKFFHETGIVETIELTNGVRRWKGYLHSTAPEAEPFHVSASVAFSWSPLDAARAHTSEEDFLTEVLGRKQRYPKAETRWMRVDLTLFAGLPYGSTIPVPDAQILGPWTSSLGEKKLDTLFTECRERGGKIVAIIGSREEIRVKARSSPNGTLLLDGLTGAGFRTICIPRAWSDSGRQKSEKTYDRELDGRRQALQGCYRGMEPDCRRPREVDSLCAPSDRRQTGRVLA